MPPAKTVAITGAFSYSGQYMARALLDQGHQVITLTRKIKSDHPLAREIKAIPLDFVNPKQLQQDLGGIDVLVNTYWVRYSYPGSSFEQAVVNSGILLKAAKDAGVRRVVHISVSNPDLNSKLAYFHGKQEVEDLVKACGLSYSILRPTIIFGKEEVLINNITWLLRKFPVFAIPGKGAYRVQPVFVEDLARLVVQSANLDENRIIDVAGPEVFSFRELLELLKKVAGANTILVNVPPGIALFLSKVLGFLLGDIMLTNEELIALMNERLIVGDQFFGSTRFSEWARQNATELGKKYTNELRRHHGKGQKS